MSVSYRNVHSTGSSFLPTHPLSHPLSLTNVSRASPLARSKFISFLQLQLQPGIPLFFFLVKNDAVAIPPLLDVAHRQSKGPTYKLVGISSDII